MPALGQFVEAVVWICPVDHLVEAKPNLSDHHTGKDHGKDGPETRLVGVLTFVIKSDGCSKIIDISESFLALFEPLHYCFVHFYLSLDFTVY